MSDTLFRMNLKKRTNKSSDFKVFVIGKSMADAENAALEWAKVMQYDYTYVGDVVAVAETGQYGAPEILILSEAVAKPAPERKGGE